MKAKILFFLLIFLFLWTPAAAQEADSLIPFSAEVITLDDATPRIDKTFQSEAGQVWSFSAVTVAGDLNPVLRIYDASDNLIAANDDESRSSTDARLEDWIAPDDGSYRLEIAREGDTHAQTSGRALFTVLQDANSIALSPLPTPQALKLSPGESFVLAEGINRNYTPIELEFEADFAEGEGFALQLIPVNPDGISGWQIYLDGDAVTVQRYNDIDNTFGAVLVNVDVDLPPGDYQILLEPQRVRVNVDGEMRADIDIDSAEFTLVSRNARGVSLFAPSTNTQPVAIIRPYASAPYYDGDTHNALPPVPAGERLYHYDALPFEAIAELRELDVIGTGGGLELTEPEGILETADPGFSSFPFAMAVGMQNFVLHFQATLRQGSDNLACGMLFRQQDGSNFTAAMFSLDGNAYVLPYQDGELADDYLAVAHPYVNPGLGAENSVMLIAQNGEATLFTNGVLIGSSAIPEESGGLSINIALSNEAVSQCTFTNIWVWTLE